ncbi:hypothetical protein Bca4012_021470 [Brassica carinata]|uniref:F-box domain-containing protein n=1 Tax=Brassica carinata TaxID=52824 RepID=A0A8X8B8N1_BRACI|nr:hypothetical protein Bca52824_000094 [Brassica carinata]
MDRISNLPDELLVKILSFVPTKEAVSTSVLSKRWEYLWIWSPNLEFGHRVCSEDRCKRLQSFLDRNLPLHRAPVIESFRLESCSSHFKPESIKMWVSTAVSHCLRELDILHDDTDPAKSKNILPSNLFACKSLVILKLVGEILLDVPNMISLPSLKTLKIKRVRYSSEETLQRLLSNCPVLEDLMVDLHDYDDYTTGKLTVAVPSLQSLSLYIPYISLIDGFVIDTPALKYFKLLDHCPYDHYFLIEKMPFLAEAYLDVSLTDLKSIFGSITSVKRLSICSEAVMLDEGFVFNQLEHLEVCICTLFSSADQLIDLLKASSKLKRLDISFMDLHKPSGMVCWNEPTTVPECILSSLQSFSWSKYTGEPEERDVVVYILKHARHLRTSTIKSSESSGVPKCEMLKELELSPRASATCELMFE